MPRKVFISFLGTGNYVECYYDIDKENPVRFVQESLIRTICKDWTEDDRIYIFCTEEAEKKNWVNNGQEKIREEIEKIGLESRLDKLNIKAKIEKVRIEEGFSEESVWSIFNKVYGKLNEGDSIYFDVTHAFRSIPIFSVVLFNYSRVMKNTKIEEIKYGAFEKLGFANEVINKPLEERIAPLLDLTNIVRLQEYNEMASSIHYFGKTKMLTAGLRNENDENKVLKDLCTAVTDLDEYIATNQLTNIREGKFIAKFRGNIKPVAKNQPKPIREILEKIKSETSSFVEGRNNKNIEAAINWAKSHEMLVQAYSLAEEYIVLRVTEHFAQFSPFGTDSKARTKYREFISIVLGLPEKNLNNDDEFHGIIKDKGDLVRQLRQEEFIQKLIPRYEEIRKRRNSIIHGNGEYTYSDLETTFSESYEACISIINEYDKP